jgi:hypothetical protein
METERIEVDQLMRVEDPIIKDTLYHIWKDDKGREEIKFAGYDMGNRTYIVKHLDDKHFICKVPSCNVLCGARGCGMVFPFGTKYFLARISDEKLPSDWNAWTGYVSLTHEIRAGRKWKEGIAILEKIWKGETKWVIFVGGGYGSYFFLGNEDDAERERARKAMWEQAVARKRLADDEEIKTGVIDKCKNHPNFKSCRYACDCGKC